MELKENLDVVIEYTKQFIDTVTPAAKQAYEVGLLTLQIDAVGQLVAALIAWFVVAMVFYVVYRIYKWDFDPKNDVDPDQGYTTFLAGCGGLLISGVSLLSWGTNLFSVWVWVKLLRPELWLAHQALEKILK